MMTSQDPNAAASRPLGSHYATRDMARKAVEMAAPMIEVGLLNDRVVGSGFLYVVVMNPGMLPGEASFEEAILYEHSFGDRSRWDADYCGFARAKARLSWQSGMDTYRMQTAMPHLLRSGDTLLWGSACLDGIVVAASGAFPWYDEVYAGTVALCLRAMVKEAREAERERLTLGAGTGTTQA